MEASTTEEEDGEQQDGSLSSRKRQRTALEDNLNLSSSFCETDIRWIGLAPTYWSHVPLCNGLVRDLHWIFPQEGTEEECIPCLEKVVLRRATRSIDDESKKSDSLETPHLNNPNLDGGCGGDNEEEEFEVVKVEHVPISRCCLVGCIVAVEVKSNNAIHYCLDDGTGLIDCLAWKNDYTAVEEDENCMGTVEEDENWIGAVNCNVTSTSLLPPLLSPPHSPKQHFSRGSIFAVGDRVRVWGRIVCLGCGVVASPASPPLGSSRAMIVEIHASRIQAIGHLGDQDLVNTEARHWQSLPQLVRYEDGPVWKKDRPSPEQERLPLFHAGHVMEWLGQTAADSAVALSSLLSSSSGINCTSCHLPYPQDHLLYCHCTATVLADDPHFSLRDGLLQELISMEAKQQEQIRRQRQEQEVNDSCNVGVEGESVKLDNSKEQLAQGGDERVTLSTTICPLRFQYWELMENPRIVRLLRQLVVSPASEIVGAAGHGKVVQHQQSHQRMGWIMGQTLRLLGEDGIVSLLDEDSDTYIFLSVPYVLEPYYMQQYARSNNRFHHHRPPYLQRVPNARMERVRRQVQNRAKKIRKKAKHEINNH